ncbi:hypothetical protein CYMTET_30629 [Cymbomonas tetramitiformis]|nr:hypothetical protein CYMTET_30629 [Cymbomonas tetramitiformis]
MAPQYVLAVGSFSGATLRQHRQDGSDYYDMNTCYRVVNMDGRIDHEVVFGKFQGVRYAIVFYKSWDPKLPKPAQFMHEPQYVWRLEGKKLACNLTASVVYFTSASLLHFPWLR